MSLTLDQVDAALVRAKECDTPEPDVALLWITRAHLAGRGSIGPDYLVEVMGVTEERAGHLLALLAEQDYVEGA